MGIEIYMGRDMKIDKDMSMGIDMGMSLILGMSWNMELNINDSLGLQFDEDMGVAITLIAEKNLAIFIDMDRHRQGHGS